MDKYCIRNEKGELITSVTLNALLKSQLFQSDGGEWVTEKYTDGTSRNCFKMTKDMVFGHGNVEIYLFVGYYIYKV